MDKTTKPTLGEKPGTSSWVISSQAVILEPLLLPLELVICTVAEVCWRGWIRVDDLGKFGELAMVGDGPKHGPGLAVLWSKLVKKWWSVVGWLELDLQKPSRVPAQTTHSRWRGSLNSYHQPVVRGFESNCMFHPTLDHAPNWVVFQTFQVMKKRGESPHFSTVSNSISFGTLSF